jgi:hypothetical protein
MARPGTLEVCRKYLYEDSDKIPDAYRDRILRVRVGFTYWYEFPTKTRTQVRDQIINEFGCSKKTAYEDLGIVEVLLGNIKNPTKDWIRYKVNSMIDEAYKLAEKQEDPKAMALAADKMGKYNMLDKPDAEPLPFDEIVPQSFDPTDDPTPLGLKKDPQIREKRKRMLEKYASEIEIEDVPFEELNDDEAEDTADEEENLL